MPARPSLFLIRHAQSENNARDEQFRVSDPELTPLGRQQSRLLADAVSRIGPTMIYCSPFLRSLQTTEAVAQVTGVVPIVRQDIYEQGGCHRGYLPGKRIAERGLSRSQLAARYPGWKLDDRIDERGWFDLDHYETESESRRRASQVRRWFEEEQSHHRADQRIAMIIHADFKLHLLEAFLEHGALIELLGDVVNTSITRLSLRGNRWRLDFWNAHEHLTPAMITE